MTTDGYVDRRNLGDVRLLMQNRSADLQTDSSQSSDDRFAPVGERAPVPIAEVIQHQLLTSEDVRLRGYELSSLPIATEVDSDTEPDSTG